MPHRLHVHLLPALFEPEDLRGGTAVVIDVLRASTTIVHALAAGAERVIACAEIEAAQHIATALGAAGCERDNAIVRGGERGGQRIPGFDFGNSPAEYTPSTVAGKTVVFTTTNGTRALLRSQQARQILVGGFANLNAILATLASHASDIHLVCAGTNGAITAEDCLCAGALATGLTGCADLELAGDAVQLAMALFDRCAADRETFRQAIYASQGGRNLMRLGFAGDIDIAAHWDSAAIIPVFHPAPASPGPASLGPASPGPGAIVLDTPPNSAVLLAPPP